ncbi:MAG: hypothetical protein F7C08_01845 [Desulfurococcales archaeon]|nr:hypothetical protein [Desulfurococcales archaeon]MCE4605261.1 hypothetical protein [Desulfurococcales archaeon]
MESNGKVVLCPRCRIPMEYTLETEKSSNGHRRLIRYYKCPACGTQITDEIITIESNGSAEIILKIADEKRTIVKRAIPVKRKRRR